MKKDISVTDAARNFADCVNRVHYQNVTFVLRRNGLPVARLGPEGEKRCTGRDLASALATVNIPAAEANAWHRELKNARQHLKPVPDKWQ